MDFHPRGIFSPGMYNEVARTKGTRAGAFLIPFHFYYGREEEGRGRLSPPGAGDNIVERVSYRQHRDRFYGETPNPTTKDDSVFPLRRAGKLAAFHFRGMNFARQVSFSIFFFTYEYELLTRKKYLVNEYQYGLRISTRSPESSGNIFETKFETRVSKGKLG